MIYYFILVIQYAYIIYQPISGSDELKIKCFRKPTTLIRYRIDWWGVIFVICGGNDFRIKALNKGNTYRSAMISFSCLSRHPITKLYRVYRTSFVSMHIHTYTSTWPHITHTRVCMFLYKTIRICMYVYVYI